MRAVSIYPPSNTLHRIISQTNSFLTLTGSSFRSPRSKERTPILRPVTSLVRHLHFLWRRRQIRCYPLPPIH